MKGSGLPQYTGLYPVKARKATDLRMNRDLLLKEAQENRETTSRKSAIDIL